MIGRKPSWCAVMCFVPRRSALIGVRLVSGGSDLGARPAVLAFGGERRTCVGLEGAQ
jgi:hypothetical protein